MVLGKTSWSQLTSNCHPNSEETAKKPAPKTKARARSTAKETKDALEQRYMQGRGMQKQSNRNHMIPVNNQVKLAWTKLGPLTHQL